MRRKRFGRSAVVVLAFLSLIFLNLPQVEAQGPSQPKSLPAIPLLLLSETPPPPQPNIAFVTSLTYDGNLEGLAGADGICQSRATAAGLPQNTYKAWLSTSSEDAIDRLGTARGWVRVDGKPFADRKTDIAAGMIFHPLRVDENGAYINDTSKLTVWTGTKYDGTVNDLTCEGWANNSDTIGGNLGSPDGAKASSRINYCKYVLEKWCNSILHEMNHAVFGYRPFL